MRGRAEVAMLREADLFAMAEPMLVEVLGRIREPDRTIVVPAPFDVAGYDREFTMAQLVEQHVHDDANVPFALGGTAVRDRDDVDAELRADASAVIARLADAACAAARGVQDGDALVRTPAGELSVRDYLLRLTLTRSLVAHYVAAYLGSTACPLPEELARPLWEITAPDAAAWRAEGYFREPLPVPDTASWRDTFLRTAGHEPHPLGH